MASMDLRCPNSFQTYFFGGFMYFVMVFLGDHRVVLLSKYCNDLKDTIDLQTFKEKPVLEIIMNHPHII